MPAKEATVPRTALPHPKLPAERQRAKGDRGLWIGLAVAGIFIVGCGAGGTSTGTGEVSDPSAEATATSPVTEPTEPAEKPTGPVAAKAGQAITVTSSILGDDSRVRYTLTNVKRTDAPNEFSAPDHGMYVTGHLEIKAVTGSTFASTSDLSFVTANGTVYESTFAGYDDEFEAADLKQGQRKAGRIVFDVPKGALKGGKIQVSSIFDDEAYGYWKL